MKEFEGYVVPKYLPKYQAEYCWDARQFARGECTEADLATAYVNAWPAPVAWAAAWPAPAAWAADWVAELAENWGAEREWQIKRLKGGRMKTPHEVLTEIWHVIKEHLIEDIVPDDAIVAVGSEIDNILVDWQHEIAGNNRDLIGSLCLHETAVKGRNKRE